MTAKHAHWIPNASKTTTKAELGPESASDLSKPLKPRLANPPIGFGR
jgi:hypothetical protein